MYLKKYYKRWISRTAYLKQKKILRHLRHTLYIFKFTHRQYVSPEYFRCIIVTKKKKQIKYNLFVIQMSLLKFGPKMKNLILALIFWYLTLCDISEDTVNSRLGQGRTKTDLIKQDALVVAYFQNFPHILRSNHIPTNRFSEN